MRKYRNQEGDNRLYFEDLGRPLVDKAFMAKIQKHLGTLATSHDFDVEIRQTPAITYVIGTEIKHALRHGSKITSNAASTNDIIENIKNHGLISPVQTDKGLIVEVQSLGFKSFGDGRRDIQVRIKDIPRIDGFGSVIYDERRLIQASIGLPYARNEINRKNRFEKPETKTSVSLILGTIVMAKNRPFDISINTSLNSQLNGQKLVLGKLSSFNAFEKIGFKTS